MNFKKAIQGAVVATAVAGLMASFTACSGTPDTNTNTSKIKCEGINECKGKSECKTATSECAGNNKCKGKGWITTTKENCTQKGGKEIK